MKTILYSLAVLLPLLSLGCEKTVHEVQSPTPSPIAAYAQR